MLGDSLVLLAKHLQQKNARMKIFKSPGAPHAFCPETDPFVDGPLPRSDVFIQHLDTLQKKFKRSEILVLPWVVSPELALAVPKAEGSTSGHVSNLDALPCVQVVPRELCVLLN